MFNYVQFKIYCIFSIVIIVLYNGTVKDNTLDVDKYTCRISVYIKIKLLVPFLVQSSNNDHQTGYINRTSRLYSHWLRSKFTIVKVTDTAR